MALEITLWFIQYLNFEIFFFEKRKFLIKCSCIYVSLFYHFYTKLKKHEFLEMEKIFISIIIFSNNLLYNFLYILYYLY